MKKIISFLLAVVMMLSITAGMDFSAYADLANTGYCGDVTYTFDSSTGALTISGNGPMSNHLVGINESPFAGCSSIKSVIIDRGVTSIGDCAFYNCKDLTTISISDSVTCICGCAFEGCTSLNSITIPNSVRSINQHAFYGCRSLTSITIPSSVTNIGEDVFSDTGYYNDSRNWKNGVLYIGNHLIKAKKELSGVYNVALGTNVIASYAFSGSKSLTRITIPNSVTTIGGHAFSGCRGLKSITIPNSVTSIRKYTFSGCKGLKKVMIPNSVTSIGFSAFSYCKSLKDITIPDSVTSISEFTFEGCKGLKSITLPSSVTSINEDAFDTCTGLTDINYSGSKAQWDTIKIGNGNEYLTKARIHYLTGSDEGSPTLKVKVMKKSAKLFWNKAEGATTYEIQYGLKSNFKDAKTKKVSAAKSSVMIKKLKKGKTYFFRIRSVKGKTKSDWSKKKSVKIK